MEKKTVGIALVLKIGDTVIELTEEQAKELKAKLDELWGGTHYHYYQYYNPPWNPPWTITSTSDLPEVLPTSPEVVPTVVLSGSKES